MPRSLAENKWKKIYKSLQLLFEAQRQHQHCYETKVQNILTEFGLNPLKFPRKDGKEERKILLEWKTHINKPLNRVEKLGKCEEKRERDEEVSFFLSDPLIYLFIFVPNVPSFMGTVHLWSFFKEQVDIFIIKNLEKRSKFKRFFFLKNF